MTSSCHGVCIRVLAGPKVLLNPGFQIGTIPIASGTITGSRPDSWIDNTDWANPKPTLLYSLVNTNPRTIAGARNWCVKVRALGCTGVRRGMVKELQPGEVGCKWTHD
jgi:hypothetical protein